jgi:predicted nicotinamide N-methyase
MEDSTDLPSVPGGWTRREFSIGGGSLVLWVPASPDALLDDADVLARNRRDDYMPYWAWIWDAALRMGALVAAEHWPVGARALELGAGLGLVGLAAARVGLAVTFTDHDPLAVEVALRNAAENGVADVRGWVLDWRALADAPRERFPIVLACDVVYEERDHDALLDTLERFLAADGVAWIGDPGRTRVSAFRARAAERGFRVETRGAPDPFTLLVLTWRSSPPTPKLGA